MASKKYLADIRTNVRFVLDYKTANLKPEVELILITYEPHYDIKKGSLTKDYKASEFRTNCNVEGINALIGELQAVAAQLQSFEQLSVGLNRIIESNKEVQKEATKNASKESTTAQTDAKEEPKTTETGATPNADGSQPNATETP